MKAVQRFTDEQLRYGRSLKPHQIVQFLDDFRRLHAERAAAEVGKSIQINIRVPQALLRQFRARAAAVGVPYQTQIKRLMEEWALGPNYRIRAVKGGPRRTDLDNTAEVLAWAEGDDRP